MRHRIPGLFFEATVDGEGASGAGEEVVAETTEAPAAETAETPAAPTLDFNSPEFQRAVAEQAGYAAQEQLQPLLELLQGGGQQQAEPLLLDPLEMEPQAFTDNLRTMMGQVVQEALAPMMPFVEKQQVADVDSFVSDRIERTPELGKIAELLPAPAEGQADDRQDTSALLIEMAASSFLPEAESMYGQGERAVSAAIQVGAQVIQQHLQSAYDAGRASYKAELDRIGQAVEQPNGAAAADLGERKRGDVFATADAFYERTQHS